MDAIFLGRLLEMVSLHEFCYLCLGGFQYDWIPILLDINGVLVMV